MATNLFRPFHPDSYSGGGSFFTDGPYKVNRARWELYTFNGKVPEGIICMGLKLEPVDKDGKSVGDEVEQYVAISPAHGEIHNDGKGLELTGDYKTAWKKSDLGIFYSFLAKTKFVQDVDMDGDDLSVMEGHIFEFGKQDSTRQAKEGQQKPKVVVPMSYIGKAGGSSKGGSKGGSKSTSAPAPSSGGADLEEMLGEYLAERVLVEKNKKGVEKLAARMQLNKYLQSEKKLDTDTCKAVGALFNDNDVLGALLDAAGWKLDGSVIKPAA